jgi:hypothetical protein
MGVRGRKYGRALIRFTILIMRTPLSAIAGVLCAWSIATTAVAQSGAQPAPDPALEQLLTRATWYVLEFVEKLSNVVSEEHYTQDSSVMLATIPIPGLGGRGGAPSSVPRSSAKHRELKADFLIVKTTGAVWQPFRDVFEVDHIPIRDREERLAKLFLGNKPGSDWQARAKAISDESARYNLGAVQRTINNPVFALVFLQPDIRDHFHFTMGRADRRMGETVRVVEYVEDMRPTIIVGLPGQDMPAFGRFWIENDTGRVVKAEVRVVQRGIKANLTTEFQRDERLGIDVPSEMREDYDLDSGRVVGRASYSRFRRFEVQSSEEIAPPAPEAPPTPAPPAPRR